MLVRTQSFDVSPSRTEFNPMYHDPAKYFKVIPEDEGDDDSFDGEGPASPPRSKNTVTSCVEVVVPKVHRPQATPNERSVCGVVRSLQFSGRSNEQIRTIDQISGGSKVSAFVKPTPRTFVPVQLPRASGRLHRGKSTYSSSAFRACKSRKVSPCHSKRAPFGGVHQVAAGLERPAMAKTHQFTPLFASNNEASFALSSSSAFAPIHPSSAFAGVKSHHSPLSVNRKSSSAFSPPNKKITCEDARCIHPTSARSNRWNANTRDCYEHTSITPDLVDELRISTNGGGTGPFFHSFGGDDKMAECINDC